MSCSSSWIATKCSIARRPSFGGFRRDPRVNDESSGPTSRESWGAALRKAGFDPSRRAAILLESVLLYLDESVVTQIFTVLRRLACRGSWIGLDVTSVDTLASPMMTPFLNKLKHLGCAPWQFGINDPETFLAAHGWEATAVVFGAPEASYGRWPYQYVPRGTPSIARAFLTQGWRSGNGGRMARISIRPDGRVARSAGDDRGVGCEPRVHACVFDSATIR